MIKDKNKNDNTTTRFSDQEKYYLKHLKKQRKAENKNYSILGRHHKNLNTFIRKSIELLSPEKKILDAGCGLSSWTTNKLRKMYSISGVDGEPEAIKICKKIYKGQDYRVGDLYNLKEFKKNYYDAVVMREVIEHFINPENAIKQIHKVLKPNGLLILTTPNYKNLLTHVIDHTYGRFFGGSCKPYKKDVHPSKFTPDSLRKLLNKYFIIQKLDL